MLLPTPGETASRPPASGPSNEVLLAYLQYAQDYYQQDGKPGKEFVAMRAAAKAVKDLYGRSLASQFGPLALRAIREQMVEQGRLCRKEINKRVHRIRRIFRWAVSMELVPASVAEGLRTVEPLKEGRTKARETEPVKPVPEEDVNAILPFVTPVLAAMIQVQSLTGMRSRELVRMRPCDINREQSTWVYVPPKHKTQYRGKHRNIPLGPGARRILEPFLNRPPEAYLFSPIESEAWRNEQRALQRAAKRKTKVYPCELRTRKKRKEKAKARVSKRPKRDHYDTNSYRGAINYALKRAKKNGVPVPHWFPYQLRHSRATLVRRKYGLDGAQVALGHTHANVTQIYAELDLRRAGEIAEQIG